MRILHVAESLATGILQIVRQLCSTMADKHDVYILHGHRAESPGDLHSLFPPSVKFFEWNADREISIGGDIAALRRLLRVIREIHPDIVHAHSSKAGALCRVASLLDDFSLIYTPHAYSFLRRDISISKRMIYRGFEWGLGRIPHLTVACSLSEFSHALGVARRVMLISNTVEVESATYERHVRNGSFRVAMAGSIRPQKNFPLFCQIAARPGCRDFEFVWVGGGTPPPDCTVPPNVSILGLLPRTEALAALRKADVFTLTSQWEGLCVAALEAMALGKPILANPGAGTKDTVLTGVNGYMCKTAEDFEAHLVALAVDRRKAEKMGRASRMLYRHNYSLAKFRSQWEDTYTHFDLHHQYPDNL